MSGIDTELFEWINGLAGKVAVIDRVLTYAVGDYFIPVVLLVLAVGMWFSGRSARERTRHQMSAIYGLAGLGFGNLLVVVLNDLYVRPRPFIDHPTTLLFYPPTDSSFPANIATVSFALACGLWLGSRRLGALGFFLATVVSFARVYTGVHYLSDVVAGAAIGVFFTLLASRVIPLFRPITRFTFRLLRALSLA